MKCGIGNDAATRIHMFVISYPAFVNDETVTRRAIANPKPQ